MRFLADARVDVIEARDWYAKRDARLSDALIQEVDHKVASIAETPLSFPIIHIDIRRARLRRFPYNLMFRIVDGGCFILACFHASRDPRAWQKRS